MKVGDTIRIRRLGEWRAWLVIGIFIGGENQEDVIELKTLDRDENTQGRMCVPCDLLDACFGAVLNA